MRRRKRVRKASWNTKWSDSWVEDENVLDGEDFDLEVFRLDMLSVLGRKLSNFGGLSKDWHSLDEEEKIDLMISKKGKNNYRYSIENCLDKTLNSVLVRFYNKFFDPKKMSKRTRILELIAVFYDEDSPLDKREEESSNIEAIGDIEEELRFFELCDILVPSEILTIIFSYVERNFTTLTKIGATCQYFYIKILSTWNVIVVTRRNLHKTSLLALKSVKSLKFREITQVEQEYLWKHVSNTRLRKLEIQDTAAYIRSSLSFLQKLKKKKTTNETNYPVQNVTEIVIRDQYHGKVKDLESSYNEIFPNVTKFTGTLSRDYSLKLLQNSDKIRDIGVMGGEGSMFGYNLNLGNTNSTNRISGIKKYLSNPSQIRTFRFLEQNPSDVRSKKLFTEALSLFENVETVTIEYKTGLYGQNYYFYGGGATAAATTETKFDVEEVFDPVIQRYNDDNKKILKCVSIIDSLSVDNNTGIQQYEEREKHQQMYYSQYSYSSQHQQIYVPLNYSNLVKTRELRLTGIQRNFTFVEAIDINLEELLSSNVLLGNQHLKKFYGDMAIAKRKKKHMDKPQQQQQQNTNFNNMNNNNMNTANNLPSLLTISSVKGVGNRLEVMQDYIGITNNFIRFIVSDVISSKDEYFEKFEIILRSADLFFLQEQFYLRYDHFNGSVKRLEIGYFGKNANQSKPFGHGIRMKRNKKKRTTTSIQKEEKKNRLFDEDDDEDDEDSENCLEGVVICISQIGNPERSEIRGKAIALGAKYSPGFTDRVTHLICPNGTTYYAPKVKSALAMIASADKSVFIVSKDWVLDCDSKKKRCLVTPKYQLFNSSVEDDEDEEEDEAIAAEEEDGDDDYSFDGVVFDEDEDMDKILMKDKRPCALIFQEFLKGLKSLQNHVDIFLFSVYNTKASEKIWRKKITQVLGVDDDDNFFKDFEFDSSELMMTRKSLL